MLLGGASLGRRVIEACRDVAELTVIVGELREDLPGRIVRLIEEPPDAGPVHALAAGVAVVSTDQVYVLAADLPFLTATALRALELNTAQCALAVDDRGRDQYLLARWNTSAIVAALAELGSTEGQSLRRLYQDVAYARCRLPGHPPPWWDCDTPEQLATAQKWSEEAGQHDPR